ncbi:MAG: aminotransferase class I/II-fold pyridoxal phosphate-dependent enzyme [Lachnospiraceae bacterium]|nr:aminotransferase class I/II-fold pyridoxal phosphate-dependent enzyme [Lachnospiraceae bacterium]
MTHGGDIYRNDISIDYSVSLNPSGTPGEVYDAIKAGMTHLGEYPDPEQESLRCALACADGVKAGNVFAGSGASELIMSVTSYVNPKHAVLFTPCFDGYRHALGALSSCRVTDIPLSPEDGFVFEGRITDCIPSDTDMIFLCDPWNPTGRNIDGHVLDGILEYALSAGISVLLDESFYHLSDKAVSEAAGSRDIQALTDRCSGLYIIRSYTKLFALPGLRMGYVISNERNIRGIRKRLPEWNIGLPAAHAMEACAKVICTGDYIKRSNELIAQERQHLSRMLTDEGCQIIPSDTVFVMFTSDMELYEPLLKKGMLIRDLTDMPGAGRGYYRTAVRSRADNKLLATAIHEIRH